MVLGFDIRHDFGGEVAFPSKRTSRGQSHHEKRDGNQDEQCRDCFQATTENKF